MLVVLLFWYHRGRKKVVFVAYRSFEDEDYFGTAVFAGGFIGAMEELTEAERRRERMQRYSSSFDDNDDDDDDYHFRR